MPNHCTLQVVASSQGPAPYGYPTAHQLPGSLSHSLQPDRVSGYSSLAAWHGGNLPAYPPRGHPAPQPQVQVSQPLAAPQLLPQQPPSVPLPPPNGIHELPGSPSGIVSRHRPYISTSAAASSSESPKQTKKRSRGPTPSTQLQWIAYSPSESTGQPWPPTTPSTCVCGASFNAPRERERHWRAFKCGSSAPQAAAADVLVIPGKYGDQKAHEVDKKWLVVLLKAFEENPYPRKEVRAELAWKMRVPRYAVDNWFWWEQEAREM